MAARALIFLLCLCGTAHASTVMMPTYPDYAGGIYRTPTPSISAGAANMSAYLDGMPGRRVQVSASARLAANAPRYAIQAVRSMSPVGLGVGLLAYLALENIYPDDEGGYEVVGPVGYPPEYGALDETKIKNPVRLCQYGPRNTVPPLIPGWVRYTYTPSASIANGPCEHPPFEPYAANIYNYVAPQPFTAPVEESDWAALETHPLPDDAAAELAASPAGLPVEAPQVQPAVVPYGDPYALPNGDLVQPMANVHPLRDGMVQVEPYLQPVTDMDGTPLPDAVPTPDDQVDPCAIDSTRVGCATLEEVEDEEMPQDEFTFELTPDSPVFDGYCPAPIQVGQNQLSYEPACQALSSLRPLVLGIAWLIAGYILIGAFRENG